MRIFGPICPTCLGEKWYDYVIVDDYSIYTCVFYFYYKSDALIKFIKSSNGFKRIKD